eukprot:TRINITY_DN7973_c0_g1_i1.p1 TRINITY_DN7973_c0_g1~~TRINITY_DN7973_c0_g1_i1.p1  ORF type:complete len:305 (+),score=87.91 TRINITY_DN7973_c0_g1_i1:61-915(+)
MALAMHVDHGDPFGAWDDFQNPADGFFHEPSSSSRAGAMGKRVHRLPSEFIISDMMAKAGGAGVGGAAAGGIMYLMCKRKCPGGTGLGKFFKGGLSSIKNYFMGAEEKAEEPEEEKSAIQVDIDRIKDVRRRTCHANCKVDALLAAAAGAAAGSAAGQLAKNKGLLGKQQGAGMPGVGMGMPMPAGQADPIDEWTTGPLFGMLTRQPLEPEDLRRLQRVCFLDLTEDRGQVFDASAAEDKRSDLTQQAEEVRASKKWSAYFEDSEVQEQVLSETEPEPEEPPRL